MNFFTISFQQKWNGCYEVPYQKKIKSTLKHSKVKSSEFLFAWDLRFCVWTLSSINFGVVFLLLSGRLFIVSQIHRHALKHPFVFIIRYFIENSAFEEFSQASTKQTKVSANFSAFLNSFSYFSFKLSRNKQPFCKEIAEYLVNSFSESWKFLIPNRFMLKKSVWRPANTTVLSRLSSAWTPSSTEFRR